VAYEKLTLPREEAKKDNDGDGIHYDAYMERYCINGNSLSQVQFKVSDLRLHRASGKLHLVGLIVNRP
jgi:hypothetical protein